MKITKIEAAGHQLDAAIEHFLKGEWVPAIHCAGAAEELCSREIEKLGGKKLLDRHWEEHDFTDLVAHKKEYIRAGNLFRDWVKHTKDGDADSIDIEDWNAWGYLMRAAIAYGWLQDSGAAPRRASLHRLREWFAKNEERLDKIVDALPD